MESIHTLKFENASLGYSEPIFGNINLNIQSPALVGLIGNNGRGKTTLLKTISRLIPTKEGRVLFNGSNITEFSQETISKFCSFCSAATPSLFPQRVFELVSLGRYPFINRFAKLSQNDEYKVLEVLDTFGLSKLKDNPITQISDGERQKAWIAKAIVQDTPVLLFDEPTAFLDFGSKKRFFEIIRQHTLEKNKITIISSHDVGFLTAFADYCWMIDDSNIIAGTTEEILKNPYFIKTFTHT